MDSTKKDWIAYENAQTPYKEIDLNPSPEEIDFSSGEGFEEQIYSAASLFSKDKIDPVPFLSIVHIVLFRLMKIIIGGIVFFSWKFFHLLTQRSNVRMKKDAILARKIFEVLGGAFVKLGQQMSLRYDLLPGTYCREFYKMQDKVPPITPRKVMRVIKDALGPEYNNVYSLLNIHEPVGSASIACTYKGVLKKNGKVVAVKIRRPGIIKNFGADLVIVDWMFYILEGINYLKPGFSKNFRRELKQILFEEMNFRREARYQELFNQYFEDQKTLKVSSPKVYLELTRENIMVSDFVSGFWMKDILPLFFKKENNSPLTENEKKALRHLKEKNIDPKVLATQLIGISFYSFFECPFFHGDPHPANILVKPNNEFIMIDFGACGVFSERERNIMRNIHQHYAQEDVGGMVKSAIELMQPLPNIDIEAFIRDLEDDWWTSFYGVKSHNAEWWERTSLKLWLSFLKQVRNYQIPIPSKVIRMIRATLLYDTIAAQLYKNINVWDEYQKFFQGKAEQVKNEMQEQFFHQLIHGPDPINYLKLKEVMSLANLALIRTKSFLSNPFFEFSRLSNKFIEVLNLGGNFLFVVIRYSVVAVILSIFIHKDHLGLIFHEGLLNEAMYHHGDIASKFAMFGTKYIENVKVFHNTSTLLRNIFWGWLFINMITLFFYLKRFQEVLTRNDQRKLF